MYNNVVCMQYYSRVYVSHVHVGRKMMADQQAPRYTGVAFIDKGIEHVVRNFYEPPVCKMPGCNKQCFVENDGRVHDFCGKTHAREFERQKRQKALYPKSTGGASGWGSSGYGNTFNNAGACHGGSMSGPSHTRSGATYGVHVAHNHPTQIRNQRGPGPILFYNRDDPYYEFTNFYLAPIDLDGKTWPTTEHYFQAQKFIGTSFTEVIRNFQRPREAFDLSRNPAVSRWRRNDWEEVKINIMRKALLAKFTQHKRLRQLLLDTGDNMLIEHSPYDKFWGDGGDGNGENHLGMLLMEIRHYLNMLQESLKREETLQRVHLSPDTHRDFHPQRSASTERDQNNLSSCSESSMDYTNTGTNNTNQNEQNDEPDRDLARPPLHSESTTTETVETPQPTAAGMGSPQGAPESNTGSGPSHSASGEPAVANLIDLDEPEPSPEDKVNPIMAGTVPQNLVQPLQPTPSNQCMDAHASVNTRNDQTSSQGDEQPCEEMDTSSNDIH